MSTRGLFQHPMNWKQMIAVTLTAVSLVVPSLPAGPVAAAPLTCPSPAPTPWASYFTRVTANTSGNDPNGASANPAISRDGRKVAFTSKATDLVTGDTSSSTYDDVFQFDRAARTTSRTTMGTSAEPNGVSRFPALSFDGRYTAFLSAADNLVAGDTNNLDDVFVNDLTAGDSLESVSTGGTQTDQAYTAAGPSITADGRYVVFASNATNLVAGDTNNLVDTFVRDRTAGTTTKISSGLLNTPANGDSTAGSISPDGRWIVYGSKATNLVNGDTNGAQDIFLYDQVNGTTSRISIDSNGNEANGDSAVAPAGAVSLSGNFIVFASKASNLVPGDSNGYQDIFLYNRQTGAVRRISVSDTGVQANGDSWGAVISGNGLFVTFVSNADNLTPGVAPGTTNVYRYDVTQRRMQLVNATRFGTAGNADATSPSISDDGRYVAFASGATDLVQNKTTNVSEIFVRDMMSPSFPLTLQSTIATGTSIALDYSRGLQRTSVPSPCDFVVQVNGTNRPVSKVSVFANTVLLTISPGISPSDMVTVSYTPGTNPVEDTLLITALPLSGQVATNQTRPVNLRSAVVTGADLVITFDQDLDTSSVPATTDFNVGVGTGSVAVSSVQMDSRRVRLTLASPVPTGSYVTVSYTSGATPLQSQAGGLIASFAGQAADNQTATLVLDTATATNNKIFLNFNLALDTTSVPAPGDFVVTVNSTPKTPSSVSLLNRTVTLTLPVVLQQPDVVVLDYTPGTHPLQTPTWSPLGPLAAVPVPNTSVAPSVQSLSVDASKLQFSVSRRIDTTSVPSATDFGVSLNGGTASHPTAVALDPIRVTLTLATPAKPGDTVTLTYSPGTHPLQDTAGSQVLPLTLPQAVTNLTPAPVFRMATVSADAMSLLFSRSLDAGSVPAPGDFTVYVGGVAQAAPLAVVVADRSVKLTLAGPVKAGDVVTVDYTPAPASPPVQDLAGSPSPSFTGQPVGNMTIAPSPGLTKVVGGKLTLSFSRMLDGSSVPAKTDFSAQVNGVAQTPSAVSISGSTVTLTLSTPARAGDPVLLSYTPGATPLRDTSHSLVLAFSNRAVMNTTTPVLSSAIVQGSQLTLTYNASLNTASVPATSDFTVKTNGTTTIGISKVALSGRTVTLTLNAAVKASDSVTVDYTAGTKPITDEGGNPARNLSAQAVTNRTVGPVVTSATVNGQTLYLNFNHFLDSTALPPKSDFTVTVTSGSTTTTASVTAITITGTRVTLTLGTTVKKGNVVVLSYNPSATQLQDTLKSLVGPLTGKAVTNLSTK